MTWCQPGKRTLHSGDQGLGTARVAGLEGKERKQLSGEAKETGGLNRRIKEVFSAMARIRQRRHDHICVSKTHFIAIQGPCRA